MPCTFGKLTAAQQQKKDERLRDLERQIESGKVTVKVSGRSVEFVGWQTDRNDPSHWHDDCALRTLQSEGSAVLRQALARAQQSDTRRTLIR